MPFKFILSRFDKHFKKSLEPGASTYDGLHSQHVQYCAPVGYDSRRQEQFNGHLATVLKSYYRHVMGKNVIEIQVAHVGGQYFLASNDNEPAEKLYEALASEAALKETLSEMAHAVDRSASTSNAADQARRMRHAAKLDAALHDNRQFVDVRKFCATGRISCVAVNCEQDAVGDAVRDFVAGQLGNAFIMIVSSDTAMHAEQKTLLALCKAFGRAPSRDEVIFSGTFRPCRGCYESLSVVRRYLLPQLVFDDGPGHWWSTTTRAHREILKTLIDNGRIGLEAAAEDFDENGCLKDLTMLSHRPLMRTSDDETTEGRHYRTASHSSIIRPPDWVWEVLGGR